MFDFVRFREKLSQIEERADSATDEGMAMYAHTVALLAVAEAVGAVADELQNHRAAGWGQPG